MGGNTKWGVSCLGVPTIAHVPKIGIHSIKLLSVPKSAIVPLPTDKRNDGALLPTKRSRGRRDIGGLRTNPELSEPKASVTVPQLQFILLI